MAPSPNPPVRRPLIAGVLFGLFLATLRGHWDSLERTHDANPFHARGSRSGTPGSDPVSEIGWDARAFGEEAAASADARREKASEKEHAVRVETRANVANDVDVSVVDVGDDDEKTTRFLSLLIYGTPTRSRRFAGVRPNFRATACARGGWTSWRTRQTRRGP